MIQKSSSISCDRDPGRIRNSLPDSAGVYLFRDSSGRVVYVGKAKDLRKRVLSYFKKQESLPHKTRLMMKKAAGLDFIVTSTENEAFILESNLIREHLPRYNIILRDDKRYPSLRLDPKEPYPRLSIIRKIKKDGAWYFGPFSSAQSVHDTLRVIDRVFMLRKCKGRRLPRRSRPCLNYQMGLCLGPCAHEVSPDSYGEVVEQVRLFLEGRNTELIRRLEDKMVDASERLDFEGAARIRDRIAAIKKTVERQHVVSSRMEDLDAVGIAHGANVSRVVVLLIRKGAVLGSRHYTLKNDGWAGPEVLEAFLKQYYHRQAEAFIPGQILLSEQVPDVRSIKAWLSEEKAKGVKIVTPQRGEKLRFVRMAVENAERLGDSAGHPETGDLAGLVQARLNLEQAPGRIEGLDISNIQGETPVGSIVSFVDGLPNRQGYRSYGIKGVQGVDDYGMMAELVSRRLDKGALPDLFLVDGGKGHLSAVKRVLDETALGHGIEVASIAKPDHKAGERYEKIYVTGRKNPVKLAPDDPVLHLLMRIRDEAHRRAISHHRRLRTGRSKESRLDDIPGVGTGRKRLLFNYFKDIESISRAKVEEIAAVPGIGRSTAEQISGFFAGKTSIKKKE